jgi:acyl-CoA thioester hydrolase
MPETQEAMMPENDAMMAENDATVPEAAPSENTVRVPLRWRDLDAQGHVYHGTYLTLLDEARSKWLRGRLALEGADAHVIVRLEIDYVSELVLDEHGFVDVECAVARLGSKSITTAETMRDPDGTVVARTKAVLVLWDPDMRVTREPSAGDRSRLEAAIRPLQSAEI